MTADITNVIPKVFSQTTAGDRFDISLAPRAKIMNGINMTLVTLVNNAKPIKNPSSAQSEIRIWSACSKRIHKKRRAVESVAAINSLVTYCAKYKFIGRKAAKANPTNGLAI